jgi:hypothetical protein
MTRSNTLGQMHELGHNLVLNRITELMIRMEIGHLMSPAPYKKEDFPHKCFGSKTLLALGWYSDRSIL